MAGTLYTSYFANVKNGKGIKISVARFNPKWLSSKDVKYWFRDLAPSINLLNDYKANKINWNDYYCEYSGWLTDACLNNRRVKHMISSIENLLIDNTDVTIYCYEKPDDNCHRHIIAELFSKKGFKVMEI